MGSHAHKERCRRNAETLDRDRKSARRGILQTAAMRADARWIAHRSRQFVSVMASAVPHAASVSGGPNVKVLSVKATAHDRKYARESAIVCGITRARAAAPPGTLFAWESWAVVSAVPTPTAVTPMIAAAGIHAIV